jgi:cyclopropane fatty-acyl-phospholipid synthase-like methyltransferase
MHAETWKQRDVALAFLSERALSIPDRQRQLDVLLQLLRFAPRPPGRVLDLGCGDAILLAAVLEAFPNASGVALGFSPAMLEQARQRLTAFGPRATIVEADLADPAWRLAVAAPFDAVVSGVAIHHLCHEYKRALYREVYELLANGGAFVHCEHVASESPRLEEIFNDTMADHLWRRRHDCGEAVTREKVVREFVDRPDRCANILAPVEEPCRLVRDIGFRKVDC